MMPPLHLEFVAICQLFIGRAQIGADILAENSLEMMIFASSLCPALSARLRVFALIVLSPTPFCLLRSDQFCSVPRLVDRSLVSCLRLVRAGVRASTS